MDVLRLARNRGFAGGVSVALDRATTPFLALVNDDAVPEPGWLDALLAPFAASDGDDIAATTAKLVLPDGSINNAGGGLLPDLYGFDRGLGEPDDGRWDAPVDVDAFCGAGAVLRTAAVRAVGGFPAHFFLYYEDTDTSMRLRRRRVGGSDMHPTRGSSTATRRPPTSRRAASTTSTSATAS